MRFNNYIKEDYTLGFYQIFGTNEISDELFVKLQKLGHKMGVKVRKSKTFQDQIKKAGTGVLHLMKLVADYSVHADVLDPAPRKKLESDIKSQFSKVRKEDVVSFIVNLDKSFLGLTSIPRHVLQNLLGITITSYDNWQSGVDYVKTNMEKIVSVLDDMGDEEDVRLAKRIYKNVVGVEL